jgi:hypothetical protein
MYISGMTSMLEPEHVIAREAASAGMHEVKVIGLPNAMLSDVMFETVLHQARLDEQYASFTTSLGAQFGEAVISLYNACAAEQCVHHFQGRQWGPKGNTICARLVSSKPMRPKVSQASRFHQDTAHKYTRSSHYEFKKPFGLSADAHVFIPGSSLMSTLTPMFISSSATKETSSHVKKAAHMSDMSTVDGDSDVDSSNDGSGI